jgi:hypothetical protein
VSISNHRLPPTVLLTTVRAGNGHHVDNTKVLFNIISEKVNEPAKTVEQHNKLRYAISGNKCFIVGNIGCRAQRDVRTLKNEINGCS